MRKEIYKIKCPKHIIFGDPQYFEEFKGAELKRLTVDYKPSEYFDTARLVLQEQPNQEFPDYMERSITLYLAPRQTMETYLKGMIFTSQKVAQKNIGVDTARYYFNVDGRDDEIKTEGDGWWGYFEEYYRQNGKDRISDAVVLTVAIPEDYDFDGMKQLAGYFFGDMQPDIPQKQKKKDSPIR